MNMRQPDIWFKVASVVASILAAAFLAWAGVVWSAWQDVSERLTNTAISASRIESSVISLVQVVRDVKADLTRHADQPWHGGTSQLPGRITALERSVERLENEIKANGRH